MYGGACRGSKPPESSLFCVMTSCMLSSPVAAATSSFMLIEESFQDVPTKADGAGTMRTLKSMLRRNQPAKQS